MQQAETTPLRIEERKTKHALRETYGESTEPQDLGKPPGIRSIVRLSIIIFLILVSVSLLITIISILVLDNGDCNVPVRLWLFVYGVLCAFGSIVFILVEVCLRRHSLEQMPITLIFLSVLVVLYCIVSLAWFMQGNLWFYYDNDCKDEFEAGYTLMFVLLILGYVGYGSFCCFCSCLVYFRGLAQTPRNS